jgi:hypothetical protein
VAFTDASVIVTGAAKASKFEECGYEPDAIALAICSEQHLLAVVIHDVVIY